MRINKNHRFVMLSFFIIIPTIYNCSSSTADKENTLSTCQDEIDNDNDQLIDCQDEGCKSFNICLECIDSDGDNYGINCSIGDDCDDSSDKCTTECIDSDNDNIWNCKDDCFDSDGDNYGQGDGCEGLDCDDNSSQCTTNCIDTDHDNIFDCKDYCIDFDEDNYGQGDGCEGSDCDDTTPLCNVDCETDNNNNGARDCDDNCQDNDRDGYGQGQDCIGSDCDDQSRNCNIECTSDDNNNSHRDCDEDCVDNDQDGYGQGQDCSADCNDSDVNNWNLCAYCADNDNDNLYSNCNAYNTIEGPDLDDNNPNCDTDVTDNDNDDFCLNYDCDDTTSYCNIDCSDNDNNEIPDCNECVDSAELICNYNIYNDRLPNISFDVKDNYVFINDTGQGLRIFDITDLHNPVEISIYYEEELSTSNELVYVNNNYAFLVNEIDLVRIIDISDIYNPEKISEWIPSQNGEAAYLNDIKIINNYAIVAFLSASIDSGGIKILDITDPSNPVQISNYEEADLYIANIGVKEINGRTYVFMNDVNGYFLITVDITDLDLPEESGRIDLDINNLLVSGDYLFAGNDSNIFIYDINTPEMPSLISSYVLEDSYVLTFYHKNNFLYILEQSFANIPVLQIFDASDLNNINNLKSIPINSFSSDYTIYDSDMKAINNRVFLIPSIFDYVDFVHKGFFNIYSLLCSD